MAYIRKAELLESVRIALSAVRTDPTLSAALIELGLTAEKLAEGWSLYEMSASQPVDAATRHGDKLLATRQTRALRREVWAKFDTAVQVARVALADMPGGLTALGIAKEHKRGPKHKRRGADQPIEPAPTAPETSPEEPSVPDQPRRRRRDRSDAYLSDAVDLFCHNARENVEVAAALAEAGYTPERLAAIESLRDQWQAARLVQGAATSDEINRRDERRAAMAALQKWWRRFTGLTSAGLRDQPELLSKLGVKVRGRKKQAR